jgi:hypothetical protein
VRVLVAEERIERDVILPGEAVHWKCCVRRARPPRDRVRRRTERQDVEDHGLVVTAAAPVVREEPDLRLPAVVDERRVRLDPVPLDAAIEPVRERADLGLRGNRPHRSTTRTRGPPRAGASVSMVESSTVSKRSPVLHVEEVVEKTFVAGDARVRGPLPGRGEESESRHDALPAPLPRHVAPLHADGIGGQFRTRPPRRSRTTGWASGPEPGPLAGLVSSQK